MLNFQELKDKIAAEGIGGYNVNLIVLSGKVLRIFPETKTKMGKRKQKFVLGFSATKNYAIIISAMDKTVVDLEGLVEGDLVQVVGSLHTAAWEDEEKISRSFEVRAFSIIAME